jgi:adenine-specific DNA-methyltransferase
MISNDFKFVEKNSLGNDTKDNLIIHGDNKLVLNSLKETHAGTVKCIYIDPPYNNGETYHHYNDKDTHSNWLGEITETLELLKHFLTKDGSIWISIDDKEMHYLKIAADKVFGRSNFVTTIIWQQRTTRENRSVFSNNHEYVLVYCIDKYEFKKARNLAPLTEKVLSRYKNPDNDVRGPWQSVSLNVQDGHAVKNQFYKITAPNGKEHSLPNGRCWIYSKEKMNTQIAQNNIWFGKDGNGVPRLKKFLNEDNKGLTPETLWLSDIAGTNKSAKKHLLELFPESKIFDTPKPEQLIQQIINIATNEGDIVLDCYLGSGSTISTAHKLKRRYIGIEKGNHIIDLVVERMKLVVNGEQGGISESTGWKGGGTFSFYDFQSKEISLEKVES